MYRAAAILLAASVLVATAASDSSSLRDSELFLPPLAQVNTGTTGVGMPVPIQDDEASLQEKILLLRNSVKGLTESLAVAKGETETVRREADELKIRLSAIGVKGKPEEQRLVETLRDLRSAEQRDEAARSQLVRLTEVVQVLLTGAQGLDPEIRTSVETEIRRSNDVLGDSNAAPVDGIDPSLSDALVVETQDDLSLVILNVGENHGVRSGMPFLILRGDTLLGTVKVVDTRERICGAVVQNLRNEFNKIKKGDRARVDAKK